MKTIFYKLLAFVICNVLVACGGKSISGSSSSSGSGSGSGSGSSGSSFTLTSEDYTNGEAIPVIHADDSGMNGTQWCANGDAENLSPQYSWENAPEGTLSYALIMDDESPPCGEDDLACRHWAVYNIPASVNSFDRGVDTSQIQGVVEADPGFYVGPCPPENDNHTYTTTIYALNIDTSLVGDTRYSRSEFENIFINEILDQAEITGTYIFTPQN